MSSSQQLDLSTLSAQQLSQVKKSLDGDIETLQSSFTKLRSAQSKFRDCAKSLRDRGASGAEILVPLTSSLYVPGMLADEGNVLVDVGTGFYVEKNTKDAIEFYNNKVTELDASLIDLDKILQGKAGNLRMVEEVLREKVMAERNAGPASAMAS